MIVCFSGTGNSLAVARRLARLTADRIVVLTHRFDEAARSVATLQDGEPLGFVCPVYAWGVPPMMSRFVRHLHRAQTLASRVPVYIYCVLTCGDDMGMADRHFARTLRRAGLRLDAAFSVTMPNTYVGLPGFDTDPTPTAVAKLEAEPERTQAIARAIGRRTRGIADVHRGALPRTKTYVARHLFRLVTSERRFATGGSCTACGRCARTCPVANIRCDAQGRPQWGNGCTACLRCYHLCPHHAISYGVWSRKAGQYVHPAFPDKPL